MNTTPTVGRDILLRDLERIGIRPGMDLLVHSSLSAIGYVPGGADTVIGALLEQVDAERGTVLVPTLTGTIRDGPDHPPNFDQARSVCWTGIIPETFRRRPDALRSLHPTHSAAAIGRRAEFYTAGHENCFTPCGEGSPYLKLSEEGGSILLLGVTLQSNTMFHAIEELRKLEYHLQREPTVCRMVAGTGEIVRREMMLHDWGTTRNFQALHQELLDSGIMQTGRVGLAESFLIDARRLVEYTLAKLQQDRAALIVTNRENSEGERNNQ